MFVGEIMSIKLLNEKRMDELIQFIHQEEITKEYLKQNQKIIYVNENQNINGVIIFDVIKNEIELCLGTDEIKQQLIAVIKKIALKDIIYQNKIIQIKTKKQFAESVGLASSNIYRMEIENTMNVPLYAIRMAYERYNINLEYIFTGKGKMFNE